MILATLLLAATMICWTPSVAPQVDTHCLHWRTGNAELWWPAQNKVCTMQWPNAENRICLSFPYVDGFAPPLQPGVVRYYKVTAYCDPGDNDGCVGVSVNNPIIPPRLTLPDDPGEPE